MIKLASSPILIMLKNHGREKKASHSNVSMAGLRAPNAISGGVQVLSREGSSSVLHLYPQKHQSPRR